MGSQPRGTGERRTKEGHCEHESREQERERMCGLGTETDRGRVRSEVLGK